MDEKLICLQLGALLHDIGKIVRRADLDSKDHSEAGSKYLKDNNLLDDKYKDVYDKAHAELTNQNAKKAT